MILCYSVDRDGEAWQSSYDTFGESVNGPLPTGVICQLHHFDA